MLYRANTSCAVDHTACAILVDQGVFDPAGSGRRVSEVEI
jgi:hypothetical protein